MENDEKQRTTDEFHRQLEAFLKQPGIVSDRILLFAKLRISANERLTLLASGVLTLTFSGALSLYGRPGFHLPAETLKPLLGAWRLLIFSIICCIAANSREARAASILDSNLQAHENWARKMVLNIVGNKLNPSPTVSMEAPPSAEKHGSIQEAIATTLGWVARVSTVFAFVLMYIFVRTLIMHL